MSKTLWALRRQAAGDKSLGRDQSIKRTAMMKLVEQVASEMAELAADRMRVRVGRKLLLTVLSFSVAAFTAGFVFGGRMLL